MTRPVAKTIPKEKTIAMLIGIFVASVLAFAALFAVISVAFMWAWGVFMTPVFGLITLSFQQAFGAVLLFWMVGFVLGLRKFGAPKK